MCHYVYTFLFGIFVCPSFYTLFRICKLSGKERFREKIIALLLATTCFSCMGLFFYLGYLM